MRCEGISDIGNRRQINEDYMGYRQFKNENQEMGVYIIADGLGGHQKGEVASRMAVEKILFYFEENWEEVLNNQKQIVKVLYESIEFANSKIYEKSVSNPIYKGMATTITLAVILENILYLANVGDSRAYMFDGNNLKKLTQDNSLIEEMLRQGVITNEQAQNHPQKNVITRAVGIEENLKVDLYENDITENQTLILTTDGLTNSLNDQQIKEILQSTDNIKDQCNILIKKSKELGGQDNISVLIIVI